jgi:hypothetical protein
MAPIEYWSSEWLDKKLEAHRAWRHAVEHEEIEAIIDEVQALPARAPRTSGRLFEETGEGRRGDWI